MVIKSGSAGVDDPYARYKTLSEGERPVRSFGDDLVVVNHTAAETKSLIDIATGRNVWDATTASATDRIELIRKMAANEELHTLIVPHIITTSALDRCNDSMSIGGAVLNNYNANPIVCYGHVPDYSVGVSKKLVRSENAITSQTNFHCLTDISKEIAKLSLSGVMPMVSIGFIPLQWEDESLSKAEAASGNFYPTWDNSRRTYTKWELFEYSIVPIPMNPEAGEVRSTEDMIRKGVQAGLIASDGAVASMMARVGKRYEVQAPASAATDTVTKQQTIGSDMDNTAPMGNPTGKKKDMGTGADPDADIAGLMQAGMTVLGGLSTGDDSYDVEVAEAFQAVAVLGIKFANDAISTSTNEEVLSIASSLLKASKAIRDSATAFLVANDDTPNSIEATDTVQTDPAALEATVTMAIGGLPTRTKAGAVLSAANLALLTGAQENIQKVIDGAQPAPAADAEKAFADDERVKHLERDVKALTEKLAAMEPQAPPAKTKKKLSEYGVTTA